LSLLVPVRTRDDGPNHRLTGRSNVHAVAAPILGKGKEFTVTCQDAALLPVEINVQKFILM
jgi:hypothetical protein